jgi:hypothetical protein
MTVNHSRADLYRFAFVCVASLVYYATFIAIASRDAALWRLCSTLSRSLFGDIQRHA